MGDQAEIDDGDDVGTQMMSKPALTNIMNLTKQEMTDMN